MERIILGGEGWDSRRGFGGTNGAGVWTLCAILVGAGVENLGNAGTGGAGVYDLMEGVRSEGVWERGGIGAGVCDRVGPGVWDRGGAGPGV